MTNPLTIQLPEDLQQTLLSHAAQTQLTLEQLVLQTLNQQFLQPSTQANTPSPEADLLLSLIGSLDLGTTDLAENHDRHIGEAFYQDLRNNVE
jgi:hypothetical protein